MYKLPNYFVLIGVVVNANCEPCLHPVLTTTPPVRDTIIAVCIIQFRSSIRGRKVLFLDIAGYLEMQDSNVQIA